MKFKIRGLKEPGNIEKERVVIEALEDGNIGNMLIALTEQQGKDEVSSKIENPYWVPDQEVSKGDLIIIYTKNGQKTSRKNNSGSSSYFFYIGNEQPFYKDKNKTVAVFDISSWNFAERIG